MDFSLPEADLFDLHLLIQAAAFALLFERERPAAESEIADRAGLETDETVIALDQIEAKGMLRRSDHGGIVGIAGITITPTQHKIEITGTIRWTWCALDAVGIIGALGRGGRFTTAVPGSGEHDAGMPLTVEFAEDGSTDSSAVVFIADGFADDSVVDTWCPTVNLFPHAASAIAWAKSTGVTGNPVTINDLMPDATQMWEHVTTLL